MFLTVLCGLTANFAYMPPYWHVKFPLPTDQLLLEIPFLVTGMIWALTVQKLRRHAHDLQRDQSSLSVEISEHRQTMNALKQSEWKLRSLYELTHLGIALTDMQGKFLEFNDAFLSICGYDEQELKTLDYWELTPREYEAEEARQLELLETTGRYGPYEKDYIRKDGSRIPLCLNGIIIKDQNQRKYIWSIVEDVTDRNRAQTALLESEKEFRLLAEAMPQIVWITRADGWNIYFNKQWVEYTGLSLEESYGHGWNKPFHPDDQVRAWDAWQNAVHNNGTYALECRLRRYDGNYRWWLIRGVPVFDADGRIVKWFGTCTDIHHIKQAEQELLISATAFDVQEGIMITDAEEKILRVNQALIEMSGYSADELVGQTPRILKSGLQDAAFFVDMWDQLKKTGAWQGEIWDRRKNGETFPKWLNIKAVKGPDDKVTHYVSSHTDITERKSAEEKIRDLAFYDPLTHLANRRLLMDRLQQAVAASFRNDRDGALLFVDLDYFKALNDRLGHDQGDTLLQDVAGRIVACIREADTAARFGGDEFVILLEDLSPDAEEAAGQAEAVVHKILSSIGQPYSLNGHDYVITASIGITLFGLRRENIGDILKQADIAMYQAKAAGRNTLRFFDPELQSALMARSALEEDLRQGICEDQFLLLYQPQVENDRVFGAEALIRWQHPRRGMVSPVEFIPLAEEIGLILPLGHWVLETACAQLAKWADDPDMGDIVLAVNVSAQQLRQPNFVENVLKVLERTKAPPDKLKLELTESILADNVQDIIEKMNRLKEQHIRFALDDFGTGYSSLSYLKRLPLGQLKIDRSFVTDVLTDPNDAAIAETIIALGKTLGMEVLAEGVETVDQMDFLAEHGCHAFQGYLFSRPLAVEDFQSLVVNTPVKRRI